MREIKVKAINQRHQSMVNRSIAWLEKYKANSQKVLATEEDCANWRKYDRLCEKTWDKYLECISELPSREIKNIESSEFY